MFSSITYSSLLFQSETLFNSESSVSLWLEIWLISSSEMIPCRILMELHTESVSESGFYFSI